MRENQTWIQNEKMCIRDRRYTVHRSQIPLCSNEGLTYKVQSQDLLDVYTAYVRRFAGFYLRTKEDFDHLLEECNAEGGKLIAYYDQNKQIQGYASLYPVSYTHLRSTAADRRSARRKEKRC